MVQDIIVFEVKFRNIEIDKVLSYYLTAHESNTDGWEEALKLARHYESQNDSLLLIKLEYLGLVLNA